ncbi:CPBP family intramembrane glutamic endopeptidase [Salinibaculum rarum]|uniref:CPBP family intramembrane glutamic endopeptidase n=1 Tax=Salinibaculum rarum TaxID=3058903 RepID=UPI00265E3475|nr:type II CAAX endopeptidase family protein [Salinibaculum sp. KK48]
MSLDAFGDYSVADYKPALYAVGEGFGLSIGVMFLGVLVISVLDPFAGVIGVKQMPGAKLGLETVSVIIAEVLLGVWYLRRTGRGWEYIDIQQPSLRDIGVAAGGVALILGAAMLAELLLVWAGVDSSKHAIEQMVTPENSQILLYLVPVSIFLVAPAEEFFYRNIIQRHIEQVTTPHRALILASFLFAAIHIPSYMSAQATNMGVSLALVFLFSLILGASYIRSQNLLVPIIIHGLFNALQFLTLYGNLTIN